LAATLKQVGRRLDEVTANAEVRRWLLEIANVHVHATTHTKPAEGLREERPPLQALPAPWWGDIAAARLGKSAAPQAESPAALIARIWLPVGLDQVGCKMWVNGSFFPGSRRE